MDSCPGSPARRADSMSGTDERKARTETRVANTHKAAHMIKSNAFVGSWQLVSTRFQSADGTPADSPYGNDAHGILMYDTNGFMAAQLAHGDRQPFPSADRKGGDDMQTRAAFESYQAYYGHYRVDEKESVIIHTVLQSLLPNWVGTEQRRHFAFEKDQLVLRTPEMRIGGHMVRGELVWRQNKGGTKTD